MIYKKQLLRPKSTVFKPWAKAVFCFAALHAGFASTDQWDTRANEIMGNFTANDLLGQIEQVAIFAILKSHINILTVNETTARQLAKLKVGSCLTSPFTCGLRNGERGWTAQHWREITTRIQAITTEENGGHPMIYGIDAAHGPGFVKNTVI